MEDNDLMELLDEISESTLSIYDIYNEITKVLINERVDEDKLEILIQSLTKAKIVEDDLYSYLENGPIFLIKAINFLDKEEKQFRNKMDKTATLCFKRIKNNLNILLSLAGNDLLSLGLDTFKKDPKFNFLLENGIDEDTAIRFYSHFQFNYEESLSYRYTTIINEAIQKTNTKKEKDKLLQIKLETTFVRGNEIEEDLIQTKFTTIKNDLASEMKPNFGISDSLKDDFIEVWTLYSIHINLIKLSKLSNIDEYTTQLLFEFKTFLLYLTKENLNRLKENISQMNFKSLNVKSILIKSIDMIDEDKKIHFADSKGLSL